MTSVEKRTQKKFLNIIDVDFGLIWNYLNVRLKKYKRFFSFPFFPSGDLGDKDCDYFHRIQMNFVMSMRFIIGDD